MTRLSLLPLLAALLLAACARPADEPETTAAPDQEAFADFVVYGDAVDPHNPAIAPSDLTADPTTYAGQTVRVKGTVAQVCQREGCWLELDNPTGPNVRVHVPRGPEGNYLWTFPTDLGTARAIVEGVARMQEVSAEDRQHLAEDAGRAADDEANFTEGGQDMVVEARGVLVERSGLATPPAAPAPATDPAADPAAPPPPAQGTPPPSQG